MRKKEAISYLVFGVLTTAVNIVSYIFLVKVFHIDFKIATTVAWILSVIFAFFTNKLYVFNSKNMQWKLLMRELFSFTFYRLLSYVIDFGMMILLVQWMNMEDIIAKIAVNVIVVIFNYFASRYFIFKNSESKVSS
jgi:putative flippase GtrA